MKQPFYKHLYFWVLVAIYLGAMTGYFWNSAGIALKPLSDAFIALIKMLIGPIVFCTIVLGITSAGDMKKVGRVGVKALLYFEVVSTIALLIGLAVGNWVQPGHGFHATVEGLDAGAVSVYAAKAKEQSVTGFLLNIIPRTFSDAFSGAGDMLQVLLVSVLFGYALNRLGKKGEPVQEFLTQVSHVFFGMMNAVMKLAPVAAFAAIAFTIGKYGLDALQPLAYFMGVFYVTCVLFIVCVLAPIAWFAGFNLFKFIRYIGDEIMIVLGTSSSETVLPRLMEKLEKMGCKRETVGLVVPAGYSFNLDGTNIYLTLATLFVAQALNIDLTFAQQATIFGVALLTSKGAAGVTGAGFITLAATLQVVPEVPVAGLALIVGIDRLMSEARALTNLIGNGVAAVVLSAWEKEIDRKALDKALLKQA